jgi:hypothetical protein
MIIIETTLLCMKACIRDWGNENIYKISYHGYRTPNKGINTNQGGPDKTTCNQSQICTVPYSIAVRKHVHYTPWKKPWKIEVQCVAESKSKILRVYIFY